jgi:hypothetical protein
MSFHDRIPRRHYRFVFDKGIVEIEYLAGWMDILEPHAHRERIELEGWERNDMFKHQWQAFVAQIEANDPAATQAQLARTEILLEMAAG